MHQFTPQKAKISKHARKSKGILKSLNEYLQSLRSITNLYKNMHLHGNPGSSYQFNLKSNPYRNKSLSNYDIGQ